MSDDNRLLKVHISSLKSKNPDVQISIVANYLNALQNIMYISGDFSAGNQYRSGGDFPKQIKETCNLVFKDLKYGSFEGSIALSDTQSPLIGGIGGTIGERAFDLAKQVVSVINSHPNLSEDLFKIIPDEFRAQKILNEIDNVWPDEKSNYSINMSFGSDSEYKLNPERKRPIQVAKSKRPKKYSGFVFGRIKEMGVEGKNRCSFDTIIGRFTATYKPELENEILGMLKKNIRLEGLIEKKSSGYSMSIDNLDNIAVVDTIPVIEVCLSKDDERLLSRPIELTVDWNEEDQDLILFNDEYGLLAEASTLKEGFVEINENLSFLYKNYVLEEDDNLTEDAILLKRKLIALFNGGN